MLPRRNQTGRLALGVTTARDRRGVERQLGRSEAEKRKNSRIPPQRGVWATEEERTVGNSDLGGSCLCVQPWSAALVGSAGRCCSKCRRSTRQRPPTLVT